MPGGESNGSIDVYANVATDIVIDINGYYAAGGFGASNSNLALGSGALSNNTTGSYNTAIGALALYYNTTGSNNIGIGFNAASAAGGGGSNNIEIGNFGVPGDNGTIRQWVERKVRRRLMQARKPCRL